MKSNWHPTQCHSFEPSLLLLNLNLVVNNPIKYTLSLSGILSNKMTSNKTPSSKKPSVKVATSTFSSSRIQTLMEEIISIIKDTDISKLDKELGLSLYRATQPFVELKSALHQLQVSRLLESIAARETQELEDLGLTAQDILVRTSSSACIPGKPLLSRCAKRRRTTERSTGSPTELEIQESQA